MNKMNDTISRQAAIDAVKKNTFRLTFAEEQNCEGHVAWSTEAVYSDAMEGALLDLPSAQPEQRWILDDAEKRYLSAVIRPFRDRVKYIAKICVDHLYDEPDYHICIIFNDGNDAMNFPSFDGTYMYKCMEEDRAYTLEELGL